jgi:hypothetical protein
MFNYGENINPVVLLFSGVVLIPLTIYCAAILMYLDIKTRGLGFILTGLLFILAATLLADKQMVTGHWLYYINIPLLITGIWLTVNRFISLLAEKLIEGNWWKFIIIKPKK